MAYIFQIPCNQNYYKQKCSTTKIADSTDPTVGAYFQTSHSNTFAFKVLILDSKMAFKVALRVEIDMKAHSF
jgi:hypothetical protein